MSNEFPDSIEQKPEHIPSVEEIAEIFSQLTRGMPYETVRQYSDELGVAEWDIKLTTSGGSQDSAHDRDTLYYYARAGEFLTGKRHQTAVYAYFLNKEGKIVDGCSVAKYVQGSWRISR